MAIAIALPEFNTFQMVLLPSTDLKMKGGLSVECVNLTFRQNAGKLRKTKNRSTMHACETSIIIFHPQLLTTYFLRVSLDKSLDKACQVTPLKCHVSLNT